MKGLDMITTQNRTPPPQTVVGANKPTYKEYQKFLSTYNEGKSDQSSSPHSLSAASSASSVPSMISETDNAPVAFNEYLQKYANKKYSTVKLNLPKKNVKTELYVQVNGDGANESLHGRKFNTLKSRKPPGKVILARHNSWNKTDNNANNWKQPPLSPAGHLVAISPPPLKQEPVPDEMIYAKTAVLNELGSKMPKLNKVPSPDLKKQPPAVIKPVVNNVNNVSAPSLPPPPPKLPDFTNSAPPISLTVKKVTPLAKPASKPSQTNRPSFISEMQSRFNENNQNGARKSSPPLNGGKFFSQRSLNTETDLACPQYGTISPPVSASIPPPLPKFLPPPTKTSTHLQNGFNGKSSPPLTNGCILPPPPKFMAQHQPKTLDVEPKPTTYVPVSDNTTNVDKSDPNVKKLVYNTYRGLLGAYNNKANNVVTMPRNMVVQDQGVAKQLESMESQGPTGPPGVTRQASDRRVEPPLVVQNAMLTKDKKPFTYTPGGIDLSEIRSPRMARRIERNANAPGVGDMPRISPPRGPTGPLPPSALAAMQPALPVQVFPAGAPPPPPPPPVNIPPPPPPMEPIPTKSIATNEGIFERPDMTKIIPENPMALLRKTGGVNRRSFIEEPAYSDVRPNATNQQDYVAAQVSMPAPQTRPVVQNQHQIPPPVQPVQPPAQTTPQFMQPKPQMAQAPRQEPLEQQQELKTSTAQLGSLYIPPLNSENQKGTTPPAKVASPPAPSQKNVQSPAQSPGTPQSPIATLHRSPRPWQAQKPPINEIPPWAQRSYSPPEADEPQTPVSQPTTPVNYQQRVAQSPVPQQAQQPSPQRIPQSPGWNQQQRSQQQPNVQSNVIGRVIIPVQMDLPPTSPNVEAVYVTQPIVLQHPGPGPDAGQQQVKQKQQVQQQRQQQQQQQQQMPVQNQQQTQKTDSRGVRIIPIQIEGTATNNNVQRQESNYSNPPTGSATPGTAKTFTRQPSWSAQGPVQSNSFKMLQKITNTDGDEDENEESTEHSPRRAQQFEQTSDQIRKMKLSEDDQEFMNKLKQEIFVIDEENPRYRGGHIPSRIFRILDATVPRNAQPGNQGTNVRTIPVQIEGDGTGKPYVPPSEQTVPEPKKYTGGKIPSRSFKVLQAMTGEACGPDQSDL